MPKQTILYTGKGDDGYTSLLGAERVAKYDLRPEAYGTVDEASAFMGLARADPTASERARRLILAAQRDLWLLMGELAALPEVKLPRRLAAERVTWLEAETTSLGQEFPPLTQFVIPGDTSIGARLDVARTVVRRAERRVAQLAHQDRLENQETILRYLNRLSSLLFALARYEEHRLGQKTTLARDVSNEVKRKT
jgi:cob(I)alamin adenosyltransferase